MTLYNFHVHLFSAFLADAVLIKFYLQQCIHLKQPQVHICSRFSRHISYSQTRSVLGSCGGGYGVMRPRRDTEKVTVAELSGHSPLSKQSHLDDLGPPKSRSRFTTLFMVRITVLFCCAA